MRSRRDITEPQLSWMMVIALVTSLGATCVVHHAGTLARTLNAPSIGAMQFAIADLDGDRKPDIASVEVDTRRANSTKYLIRLQFAGGNGSHIRVDGPDGGLRLAAQDVNGDDSLDLVLTSAVDRHVIQVLLNDGHGNFSAAGSNLNSLHPQDADRFLRSNEPSFADGKRFTTSRWSFGKESSRVGVASALPGAALLSAGSAVGTTEALRSCQGRAPPSATQQF